MLIGCPKEIKPQEFRVGLTPNAVKEIILNGHKVLMEKDAGAGSGFSDQLYKEAGGTINFSQEELLFAAFHHDLGKLGSKGKVHYVTNPSDWHVKNQGKIYVSNSELSYLTHTDRTFFLLQEYGITTNENEYFGIKLTDGMYDEDNVKYFKVFDPKNYLKCNIQFILHWADHMSTCIERDVQNAPF